MRVCFVRVIVKRPALPPCTNVVDGPYYYVLFIYYV